MPMSKDYPRLRPVEVFPAEQGGEEIFVVHDPSGLASGVLTMSQAVVFLLSLMDGEHSLADIELAFTRQAGDHL